MISGIHHKVEENCTLVGYYAASSANLLLTFHHKLSVSSLGVKNPKVKMGKSVVPKLW